MTLPACDSCAAPTATTREAHEYTEYGRPGVWLRGVDVRRCTKCAEFWVTIPCIEPLHEAIAATAGVVVFEFTRGQWVDVSPRMEPAGPAEPRTPK